MSGKQRKPECILSCLTFLGVMLCGPAAFAEPTPKPCPHRPGARKAWEGAFCTGNLQLGAPLSVFGVGLVHNSVDSYHQDGFGYGWNLNIRSTLSRDASDNITITRPDGSPVFFKASGSTWTPEPQLTSKLSLEGQDYVETLRGGNRLVFRQFSQGNFFLYQIADRNGNVITINRDAQDHESTLVDAFGRTTTFQWNGEWLQSVQDHEGRVFVLEINQMNELASITQPAVEAGTPVERFVYDPEGRHLVVSHISPQGMITGFAYYDDGSVKTLIDPMGFEIGVTYTASSVIQEFALGERFVEEYRAGALVSFTNNLGEAISYERDGTHHITQMVDEQEHAWFFAYNDNGDLIYERDPTQLEFTATYNDRHDMLSHSRRNLTWRHSYNEFNQIIQETNPLGETVSYRRDARGNLNQVIGPLGEVRMQVEYYPNGSVKSLTDPFGQTLALEYDEFGNIRSAEHPSIGTVTQRSTPMGLVQYQINTLGEIAAYSYDARGEIIGFAYPADPNIIQDGGTVAGVLHGSATRDLDNRTTEEEICLGGNCSSQRMGFEDKTGATNYHEKNGQVVQDGPCPCEVPSKPDGGDDADGGVDGGADGDSHDGDGQDGDGQDASDQDGGGQDGGDEEGCEDAGPLEEQCQAMAEIQCDQTVSGSVSGSGSMSLFTPCSSDIPFTGGEFIYKFTPDAESLHASALLSDLPEGVDLDVFILESVCNPAHCKEKGSMEAYFGVKPCMAPYYIVVKGYEPDDSGSYTLKLTCYQ